MNINHYINIRKTILPIVVTTVIAKNNDPAKFQFLIAFSMPSSRLRALTTSSIKFSRSDSLRFPNELLPKL